MPFIVVDNDRCTFDKLAEAATTTVSSTTITGMGLADNLGNKLCIIGDERSVTQTGTYKTVVYSKTSGTITATIDSLDSVQISKKVFSNGKAVILCTGKYKVKFSVNTPAMDPDDKSDTTSSYMGTGSFITSNTLVESP
jgi:hypothetical protein